MAGIPTAWVAKWGSGKPVIALGSDIDGIPQASQKPGVAYPDPIIAGAPGHGEGHNTGMPLNVVAAIAVKQIMERDKLPGTIMLWPGVAEEQLASKAWFVRDGVFKDVDVVLFTHVGNNLGVSWGEGGGNGMVSVEYTFEGETAHSAGAPWRGRSALDAVELMSIGWQYRREHLRLSQRSHSRDHQRRRSAERGAAQRQHLVLLPRNRLRRTSRNMWDIGNKMAEGAALMTNTKWTSRILGAAYPQHMNKAVAEAMYENIKTVGLPTWSEEDQTLAKALQKELGNPRQEGLPVKLGNLGVPNPDRENTGGGSDDIGDVSWNYPTVTLRYPVEHPRPARTQLVERDRQRDADRAQGRGRRREGAGDDGARPADAARAREGGVGLLQQRADEGREVRAVHQAKDTPPATHLNKAHPRQVPRADEEVSTTTRRSSRPISISWASSTRRCGPRRRRSNRRSR